MAPINRAPRPMAPLTQPTANAPAGHGLKRAQNLNSPDLDKALPPPPSPAGHALKRAADLKSPDLNKPLPEAPGPGKLQRAAALEGPQAAKIRPPDKASGGTLSSTVQQMHTGVGRADLGTVGDFRMDKLDDLPVAPGKHNVLGSKVENKKEHTYKKLEFKRPNGDPGHNLMLAGQSTMKETHFKESGKGHFDAQGKAELKGTAAAVKYENTHTGRLGTTQTKASAEVSASLTGEGALKASKKDPGAVMHLKGEAFAGAKAEGKVEHSFNKHTSVGAEGNVMAGAFAGGTATAAFDKKGRTAMVKASGFALAGAHEFGNAEAKVGPVRVSGGAGAIQGLFAGASFAGGMNDGRLGFTADVGASLGVGMRARAGASVNMNPLFDALSAPSPVSEALTSAEAFVCVVPT